MKIRTPHVAGLFYPAESGELKQFLSQTLGPLSSPQKVKAIMVPHAGYVYSGATAARVFARVKIPATVLMLGPNHTGFGRPFSIMTKGFWQTPLGKVPIDESLANELLEGSDYFEVNESAHAREHSLEVEVPFLQHLNPAVKIVPVAIHTDDFQALREAAEQAVRILGNRDVLILASSDMTHYESVKQAEVKDRLALEAILALDENRLKREVELHDISMCGFYPMYMTLIMSKQLGATKAELIEYTHSGIVSRDYDHVVGYAGVVIS